MGRLDLRRLVGSAFAVAVLTFLLVFVGRNVGELRAHEWSIRPILLLLSLAVHIAGLLWGVAVWRMLLARVGVGVSFRALARIWFLSSLGRYVPGKIWQFVGAAHIGAVARIPPAVTVTSLAVHTGFFLIGAVITAALLLPADVLAGSGIPLAEVRWLALLGLLLAHPAVIRSVLALVRRVGRRPIAEWSGRWIDGILLVALSGAGWVTTGGALYLFLVAITPAPGADVGFLIGANAISFVAGYLVFVAPAGLGAKEGVLTVLLSLYMPAPVAAMVAVAARLWTVVAEVLPALFLLPAGRGEEGSRTTDVANPRP